MVDNGNSLVVPKTLLRKLDPEHAIVLANLIDRAQTNHSKHPDLGGWFFYPNRMQCIDTGISEPKLIQIKKNLMGMGFFITETRGGPPKEFYHLDDYAIQKFLDSPASVERFQSTNRTTPYKSSIPLGIDNIPGTSQPKEKGNNETKVSKARPEQDDGYPSEGWKADILQLWNSLQGPTKHTNLKTKTLQKVNDLLTQLNDGTFFHSNTITDDFATRHKIPKDRYYAKKVQFTPNQITKTIELFGLCWLPGHWPGNKTTLPKSFESFLHNPMTGTSWFLMIHFNPGVTGSNINNYNSKYYPIFKWYLPRNDAGNLHRMVDGLERWVRDNFDLSDKRVQRHFMSTAKGKPMFALFFEKYSSWLRNWATDYWKEDWLRESPQEIFQPWGKVFVEYLKRMEEELALRPKERQ